MKSRALLLLSVCLWLRPALAETIKSFDVLAKVNTDCSLDISENIVYDFEGAERHGIYRDIPIAYERNGGIYTTYVNIEGITDGAGHNWEWSSSRDRRNLHIQIGDPKRRVSGVQTYQLHYMVRRAINFFGGAPEVYWNATGDQWLANITQASLKLVPPPGVASSAIKTAGFAGPPGSTNPCQIAVSPDGIVYSTINLPPGQGLTIVAGLPAGSLVKPSVVQQLIWLLLDWWPVVLFPLLALAFVLFMWSTQGRDVEGNLPAQVEWSPPKDLSPAEVGTLLDESCDMADIISTLLDLAVRGYLRIEELDTQGFLFMNKKDYAFDQLQRPYDPQEPPLARHEKEFLVGLFGSEEPMGGSNRVLLSSLKEQFYVHLEPMKDSIYESLTQKSLFSSNPQTTRQTYQVAGFLIAASGAFALFFLGGLLHTISYGVGLLLAGAVVLFSAKAMPAKTATGSRKLRECVGFQRYVKLAEKARIEKLIKDDPTIFGRLLPYAIVLGVGDAWADKFAGLLTEPPSWYVPYGYGPGYVFYPRTFVSDLGSGMNTMGSTFSSRPAPKSTGGSGGSGFSGGGSGGGFGGGGGGSW